MVRMFSVLYLGLGSPKLIAILEKLQIGLLKKNADAGFLSGLTSKSFRIQSSSSSENSSFYTSLFSKIKTFFTFFFWYKMFYN